VKRKQKKQRTYRMIPEEEIIRLQSIATCETLGDAPTVQTMVEIVEKANAWGEELVGLAKQQLPPSEYAFPCRAGCCYCCTVQVMVTAPEVVRIVEHLRAVFSREEQEALEARVVEQDRITRGMSAAQRGESRLPCPLLVDGLCSVYSVRPLQCQGWNSLDVDGCRRSLETMENSVVQFLPQLEIMANVQAGIRVGLALYGRDADELELTAALRIALEDATAIERWAAGEPVFQEARLRRARPVFTIIEQR
jgi:hypothetical protein